MDAAERKKRLDALEDEPDPAKRHLIALGVVSDRLRLDGLEPILVGGPAVEFYTAGGYATKDIDLALPHGPKTDAAFAELGFAKEGRYWYRDDLDLLFGAAAPAGLPGETAPRTEISVDGLKVVIIGVEDLIIDRLRMWVHGNSPEDGRWASRLVQLYATEVDWNYLESTVAPFPRDAAALAELRRVVDA